MAIRDDLERFIRPSSDSRFRMAQALFGYRELWKWMGSYPGRTYRIRQLFFKQCGCSRPAAGWVSRGATGGNSIFGIGVDRKHEAGWFFPFRGPRRQVFVVGVEAKATIHCSQKVCVYSENTLNCRRELCRAIRIPHCLRRRAIYRSRGLPIHIASAAGTRR